MSHKTEIKQGKTEFSSKTKQKEKRSSWIIKTIKFSRTNPQGKVFFIVIKMTWQLILSKAKNNWENVQSYNAMKDAWLNGQAKYVGE